MQNYSADLKDKFMSYQIKVKLKKYLRYLFKEKKVNPTLKAV